MADSNEFREQFLEMYYDDYDDLRLLAETILALAIPKKSHIHAGKMDLCKEDEYSLAFYEVAKQLLDLLISGYSLEDGVRALADGELGWRLRNVGRERIELGIRVKR